MIRKSIFAVVLLFSSCTLFAQELDSILNLNAFTKESELQKQLNQNVSVSAQNLSSRETPGIISIVTAEEIQNSGARDLTDVLRLVPGFEIMQDLQFVMGLGLRGNWANEGKVLVMVDGQPFNDLLYQSVAVGNRFFVDAIERIEIIRGPGSAIYGGSAEYGVINIVTKAASNQNGIAVYGAVGLHADAIGRTNGGVTAASSGKQLSWDVSLFKGDGIVSDRQYQDIYQSDPVNLADVTHADPLNINAGIRFKGLSFRAMLDRFATSDPESNVEFNQSYLDLQYEVKMNDNFRLTPRLQYLNQIPWYYDYPVTDGVDFEVKAKRMLGQVDGDWNVSRKVNVNFGALYFQDKSIDVETDEEMLTLNNIAFYTQALFKHRLANATVGFRFEKNNRYDGAFVPRIGLTKKIENLHFKVLYSSSFRSPSLQNVALDTTGAKPERSNVFEFELGYQFTPEMLISLNAFHITTRDVIIYSSEGEGESFEEVYESDDKSGSKGIELVYSIRKEKWYGSLTYSFNRAITDNTVEKYIVPQTTKQYVGMPQYKVTGTLNVNITSALTANTTFVASGKRYAYTELDENDEPIATELSAYIVSNLFLNYKNLIPGLTLGAGVYDLLNERPAIVQAYNGGIGAYAPIPGRSREYVIKLSYQLNFKE